MFFFCSAISFAQQKTPSNVRIFPTFRFEIDEQVSVDVKLHKDAYRNPVYYTAYLETDVCDDNLCNPVSITIIWDLIGRFLSYRTDKKHILTKFDHVPLTKEDHIQFHRILSDTASILRDYEVEDMIDKGVRMYSNQVDAVTSATSVTFDGATVEGALYTVYKLWHFTNGTIRKKIKEFTISLLTDEAVLKHMLTSENRDYVSFVFKNITQEQRHRLESDIILLLGSKDAYIPHFALAQLDNSVIEQSEYQHRLITYFHQADDQLKNALLDRLSPLSMDATSLMQLLSSLSNLQENQIRKIFVIIDNNKTHIDSTVRRKLQILSSNKNRLIAQQATTILRK